MSEPYAPDPDLCALVDETMAYKGHVDWRCTPYRPQFRLG